MHVLQWLFKISQDEKQAKYDHRQKGKQKASNKNQGDQSKRLVYQKPKKVARKALKPEETSLDCRNFRHLALLLRSKGRSRAYLYSTLDQKILNSINHRQQQHYIRSMTAKEDHHHHHHHHLMGSRKKGLPFGDSRTSSPIKRGANYDQKKSRVRGDQNENNNKTKNVSKMKELLRWAAASKSEKGAKFRRKKDVHSRSRLITVRSGGFDEELSNDPPNVRLKWEVESHSTTCSVYDKCPKKTGQWITGDDEFVVLEL